MDHYAVGYNDLIFTILKERGIPLTHNILISMMDMTPNTAARLIEAKGAGIISKVALDSGTFGLQKANPKYDAHTLFHRFCEFAKGNASLCDLVFNFDRDFTHSGFEENYEYLQRLHDAGVDAIPVTHDIKNKEYQRFIDSGFTKIAIGQDTNRSKLKLLKTSILDMTMQGVKHIHLFGVGTPQTLLYTPLTSADASSHIQYANYGTVNYWDDQLTGSNKTQRFTIPIYKHNESLALSNNRSLTEHKERLLSILKNAGIDITWRDLLSEDTTAFIEIVNIYYYLCAERACTEMHHLLWAKALTPS